MAEREFSEFVRAVQQLDLEDRAVAATSHTSAVSVRDWEVQQDRTAAAKRAE